MKIVSVSIVRNEADIIEMFIRYHLQLVHHMIVINHRSVDSTGEILANMKNEGLGLTVIQNNSLRQPQKSALNEAIKVAVNDCGADWVLPLDADEFICSTTEKSIAETVRDLPDDVVTNIPWRSYVPLALDNAKESNILKRIQYCKKKERQQTYKVLVPRRLAKKRHGVLGFGSHHYKVKKFYIGKKVESVDTDKLFLAHFPIRDADQVKAKAIMGWLSVLAKPDRGGVENFHLRKLYDKFKLNMDISVDELTSMAFSSHTDEVLASAADELMHAPVKLPEVEIELRYKSINRCDPTMLLYKMAEEYAEAISAIKHEI